MIGQLWLQSGLAVRPAPINAQRWRAGRIAPLGIVGFNDVRHYRDAARDGFAAHGEGERALQRDEQRDETEGDGPELPEVGVAEHEDVAEEPVLQVHADAAERQHGEAHGVSAGVENAERAFRFQSRSAADEFRTDCLFASPGRDHRAVHAPKYDRDAGPQTFSHRARNLTVSCVSPVLQQAVSRVGRSRWMERPKGSDRRLPPPHQTVHAVFLHTAFLVSFSDWLAPLGMNWS